MGTTGATGGRWQAVTDLRPMSDNTDARAVRTRAKLVDAFHEVVRDTDPDEISVSALTRAAGVNRTSFYAHFSSPEDLAVHALGDLLDVVSSADIILRSEHAVTAEEASRRALREIVDFVWERRASYTRLLGPAAPARVPAAVTEAFAAHATRSLRLMPNRPDDADPAVTAQFIAAGVLVVVGRWLADPRRWSRERLVTALMHCLPGWVTTDQ
ncbi:TetR/AcrR family transcriptional regulator [Jatrophihabitans sp. YIM 134969]